MAVEDRVLDIVEPLITELGIELFDVEFNGGTLRVTVDKPGGLNLDEVAAASRTVSHALDEQDPLPGAYTLEVSSPGLERRLRKPHHFDGAVGEDVALKLAPYVEGERRFEGKLLAVNNGMLTVIDDNGERHEINVDDVTKARTVFQWGPAPKPGKGKKKSGKKSGAPAKVAKEKSADGDPKGQTKREAAAK